MDPFRLIVCSDMTSFSAWSGVDQEEAKGRLVAALDDAYAAAGTRCVHRQPGGDGFRELLPTDAPAAIVAHRFARALGDEIAIRNRGRQREALLRVRVVVGMGTAGVDATGTISGPRVGQLCRIVDSAQAKAALGPDGQLVVLYDPAVHEAVDGAGLGGPWLRVEVPVKPHERGGPQVAFVPVAPARAPDPRDPDPREPAVRPGGLVLPDGPLPPADGPF